MAEEFIIMPPSKSDQYRITASVGFISPVNNSAHYIVVKNKRGWDIPGGHVIGKETPLQTLKREVREETGCRLKPGAVLIAILESSRHSGTAIAVYRGSCMLSEFKPTKETVGRRILTKSELIKIYSGDAKILTALFTLKIHA